MLMAPNDRVAQEELERRGMTRHAITGILALLSLGIGCATAGTTASGDVVPPFAGIVGPATACRISGAWTLAGQPIEPPAVTRCVLPRYPSSMRSANQEGDILWRVVVDSAGITDSSSVSIIRSSSPDLVVAVRQAAPYLRFAPRAGRDAIVVELPMTFTLGR